MRTCQCFFRFTARFPAKQGHSLRAPRISSRRFPLALPHSGGRGEISFFKNCILRKTVLQYDCIVLYLPRENNNKEEN